MPENMRKFK